MVMSTFEAMRAYGDVVTVTRSLNYLRIDQHHQHVAIFGSFTARLLRASGGRYRHLNEGAKTRVWRRRRRRRRRRTLISRLAH
jgi:hypothetical protein